MACRRDKIQSMLVGDLPADQTHQLLDHIRDCAECRKAMDCLVSSNPSNFPKDRPAPEGNPLTRYQSATAAAPRRRRGLSRRTLLFVALTAVVATIAWNARKESRRSEGDFGPLCGEALRKGQAFVLSPQGILAHRPRVVEVLLPIGVQSCSIELEPSGKKAYRAFFVLGGDLNADRVTVKVNGEELEVLQVLVPFPDHQAYPLDSPEPHRLRIVPEPGQASAWSTIRIGES